MLRDNEGQFDFATAREQILALPEFKAAASHKLVPQTDLTTIQEVILLEDYDTFEGELERYSNEQDFLAIEKEHNFSLMQYGSIGAVFLVLAIAMNANIFVSAIFVAIALFSFSRAFQLIRLFSHVKTATIEQDYLIQKQAKRSRIIKNGFRQYVDDLVNERPTELPSSLRHLMEEFQSEGLILRG